MKIVIVNNDFPVYWKGRLTYLRQFLASRNIDLNALELFGKGSPYSFDIYNNKERWWRCLFPDKSSDELSKEDIEKALLSALNKINPDIVIGPSIVFFAGALGMRWAKNHKKKFVMFDDAKPSQVKRNFIVQRIKNLITSQIDGLWLPSEEYDKEFLNLQDKKRLFFYGYSCIDNEFFKFKGERELNHRSIICIARLVPIKNLDNLLKSWKLVEEKNNDYSLSIIGDGPLYYSLNKLASTLQLKRVNFIGAVDNRKIPPYLHHADAFILPSFSESWGLVVNEAMAAGLPVLLSNKINASHSLLKEEINGYSLNPASISDLSAVILKYINLDMESKKAMSANSLAIINGMSYDRMCLQLLDALMEIEKLTSKRPGLLASLIINSWQGRYNKAGWDKL